MVGFLRYLHANGASMFFIVVYLHTFRGLYYGSYLYPKEPLWIVGCCDFVAYDHNCFYGLCFTFGVKCLFGVQQLLQIYYQLFLLWERISSYWVWGGYSIANATLNRFFSFHYLFPFIILALVFIHLVFLHEYGSNNPLGVKFTVDTVTMYLILL